MYEVRMKLDVTEVFGIPAFCEKAFHHFLISDVPPHFNPVSLQCVNQSRSPASIADHATSRIIRYIECHTFRVSVNMANITKNFVI